MRTLIITTLVAMAFANAASAGYVIRSTVPAYTTKTVIVPAKKITSCKLMRRLSSCGTFYQTFRVCQPVQLRAW